MSSEAYAGPAIVELFGHIRLAGHVQEVDQYGTKMLRVDVPEVDGRAGFTTFKGGNALYAVTPTTADIVVEVVRLERPAPPIPYSLQMRALPAPAPPPDADEVGAEDDHTENDAGDDHDDGPGF